MKNLMKKGIVLLAGILIVGLISSANFSPPLYAVENKITDDMTVDGNVGIGTTAPSATYKLRVQGAAYVTSNLTVDGTFTPAIIGAHSVTGTITFNGVTTDITTGTNEHLALMPNGTGNVGIGTTAPSRALVVNGDIEVLQNEVYLNAGGNYVSGDTAGYVRTNGGFLVAGNVGIGTTGPSVKFHVVGDGTNAAAFMSGNVGIGMISPEDSLNTAGNIRIGRSDTWGNQELRIYGYDTGASARRYMTLNVDAAGNTVLATSDNENIALMTGTGNVGIGTTGPEQKLHISDGNILTETLGSELVTNGGMELDSNWSNYGTPTTNERSNAQAHSGTYSRHVLANTNNGMQQSGFSLTAGKLYKLSFWEKGNGKSIAVDFLWPLHQYYYTTSANWTNRTIYVVASATASYSLVFESKDSDCEFYIDDVTVTEVTGGGLIAGGLLTAPGGTSGIKITNTGNVGIGTTDPGSYKLNVNGNTNITGTLTTSGTINGQTIGTNSALNALTVGGGYGSGGITMDTDGNLQVDGNIYLKGIVWKENLQQLLVKNNSIRLNSGGSSQDAKIEVEGTGAATLTTIQWNNTASNWSIDKGLNITAGNVGIGTTGPSEIFHVNGGAVHDKTVALLDAAQRLRIAEHNVGTGGMYLQAQSTDETGTTNASSRSLLLNPGGGNVGIGTTGPGAVLDVKKNVPVVASFGDSVANRIDFYGYGFNDINAYGVALRFYSQSSGIQFRTGAADPAVTLTNSGNVGIGTTAPGYSLDVLGSTNDNVVRFKSATGQHNKSFLDTTDTGSEASLGLASAGTTKWSFGKTTGDNFFIWSSGAGVGTVMTILQSTGNVGIGTTGPSVRLEVKGTNINDSRLRVVRGDSPTVSLDVGPYFILGSDNDELQITAGVGRTLQLGSNNAANRARLDTAGNFAIDGNLNVDGTGNSYIKGNVGIGTTGPNARLDVQGGRVKIGQFDGAPHTLLQLGTSGTGTWVDGIVFGYHVADNLGFSLWYEDGNGTGNDDIGHIDMRSAGGSIMFRNNAKATPVDLMIIKGTGNVGIGTTGPGVLLDVYGGAIRVESAAGTNIITAKRSGTEKFNVNMDGDWTTVSSPTNRLQLSDYSGSGISINNGNVGIGTTSPTGGKLHVEGQCVTGDTVLPIIRGFSTRPAASLEQYSGYKSISKHNYIPPFEERGYFSKTRDITTPQTRDMKNEIASSPAAPRNDRAVEFVPIVDVQPGDYVLSLNEETQRIEPHRINGLLDMGVKPVFRLTTASGRAIRTTGNHPYLTKEGWRKVVELQEGIQIAVSNVDSWDGFYHSAQIKSPQPLQSRQELTSTFLTSLFRIEPETCKHQYKEGNPASYSDSYRKSAEEIACKADRKDSLCQISKKFSDMFLTFGQNLIHWLKYNIGSKLCQETYADVTASSAALNVIARSDSDEAISEIALLAEVTLSEANVLVRNDKGSDILWDKIVSIEYIGYEQVYDIEVEGTHNFIGGHWVAATQQNLELRTLNLDNGQVQTKLQAPSSKLFFGGIIAHNTYINGGLTATGTISGTFANLITSGNLQVTGTGPHYISQGNVGIGTTAIGSKLEVDGSITVADSFGSNTVTNGDMETGNPPTGWSEKGTPTTFERAIDSGSNRLHIVADAADEGAVQNANVTAGLYYKYELDYKVVSGTLVIAIWDYNAGNQIVSVVVTDSSYTHSATYFKSSGATIQVKIETVGGAGEFYIDNIEVKPIASGELRSYTGQFEGALRIADGTASAPSLGFSQDTDTGLYRLAANKIGLITGGSATQGITIDTGNVGIGTTAPGAKLDVVGGITSSGTVTSGESHPGSLYLHSDWIKSGVSGYSGNYTDIYFGASAIKHYNTSYNLVHEFYNNGDAYIAGDITLQDANWVGINSSSARIIFDSINGIGIMNGNVGIGTTGPGYQLQTTGNALFGLGIGVNGDPPLSGWALRAGNGQYWLGSGYITGTARFRGTITNDDGALTFNQNGQANTNIVLNPTSGNVGIGTTSPTGGKLHVEGQCVTGDTLLPVIRVEELGTWNLELGKGEINGQRTTKLREAGDLAGSSGTYYPDLSGNQKISSSSFDINEENQGAHNQALSSKLQVPPIHYIPITDVKPGDYVLSLNEETQRIEPHRINGLLDMGVKPVFRLTTASGRSIRTTGNHPYLTKDGWRKVIELSAGEEIAVPKSDMFMFSPGDYLIMDKHCEYYQAENNKDTQHNNHFSSPFSTTRIKNNIIRDVNSTQNMSFCGNDNLAKNSPAKYPATMILAKSPTSFAIDSLDFELSHFIYGVKHITEFIACQVGILGRNAYADITMPVLDSASLMPRSNTTDILRADTSAMHVSPVEKPALSPSTSLGINSVEGSDILWDKVVSIEYIGYEQVYDIEVEGTHNFVAGHWVAATQQNLELRTLNLDNGQVQTKLQAPSSKLFFGGIIAHNTYINGGLTATGTISGTFANLITSGNLQVTGTGPHYISQGSVGIGTTAPEAKLDVLGTLRVGTAGDVNIAHDLYFEDMISSAINSYGPLTITSGNSNSNYNLVLKGSGTGKVYIDDDLEITGQTTFPSGLTVASGNITASSGNVSASAGSGTFGTLTVTGAANLATSSGNVGIGTTNSTSKLHISTTTNEILDAIRIGPSVSGYNGATISFTGAGGSDMARIKGYYATSAPNDGGAIILSAYNNTGAVMTDVLTVRGSGFVGIGTTGPNYKLEVRGTGQVAYFGDGLSEGDERLIGIADNGVRLVALRPAGFGGRNDLQIRAWSGSAVTDVARFTGGGNVGIGTTAPARKLDINGSSIIYDQTVTTGTSNLTIRAGAGQATGPTRLFDIFANDGTTARFHVTDVGNVGIGTTGPGDKLDVAGAIRLSSNIVFVDTPGVGRIYKSSGEGLVLQGVAGSVYNFEVLTPNGYPIMSNPTGTSHTVMGQYGNVGIGTTGPSSALHISKSIAGDGVSTNIPKAGLYVINSGADADASFGDESSSGYHHNLYVKLRTSGTYSGLPVIGLREGDLQSWEGTQSHIAFGSQLYLAAHDGYNIYFRDGTTDNMVITGAGNVGIGTTVPQAALQVGSLWSTGYATNGGKILVGSVATDGPEAVNGVEFESSFSGSGYGTKLYTNNAGDYWGIATRYNSASWTERLVVREQTGNVGIGTASPGAKLEIHDTSATSVFKDVLNIRQAINGGANGGGAILFTTSNAASFSLARIAATDEGGEYGGTLRFFTHPYDGIMGTDPTEKWRITSAGILQANGAQSIQTSSGSLSLQPTSGNVGIGTTAPTEKIQIISPDGRAILGQSTTVDSTGKSGRWGIQHRTNAEEPFFAFVLSSDTDGNILTLGGGTGLGNAATILQFITAANITTTGGTERMRIGSNGGISIGSTYVGTDPGSGSMIISGNVGIGTTAPGGLLALRGTLSSALTGTVSVTINTAAVTGVGTAFTTELAVGDSIKIGSETFTVSAIASATSLTLDSNHLAGASGVTAYRDPTLLAINNGDAVNKLTITRTGNVGIGTTNPTEKLYVSGNIAATGTISGTFAPGDMTMSGDLTINGNDIIFGNGSTISNATDTDFNITGDGDIFLRGSGSGSYFNIGTPAGGASNFHFFYGATDDIWMSYGTSGIAHWRSGSTETMSLLSTGNLGIGTTSPGELLHVAKSQDTDTTIKLENLNTGTSAYANLELGANAATAKLQTISSAYSSADLADYVRLLADSNATGLILHSKGGQGIQFWVGDSDTRNVAERMRITSTGNVGIGTTTPGAKLHVYGDAIIGNDNYARLHIRDDGTYMNLHTEDNDRSIQISAPGTGKSVEIVANDFISFYTASGAQHRMRITNSGNVGIGTTGPGARLQISGGDMILGVAGGEGAGELGARSLILEKQNTADASNVRFDSQKLVFRGSIWTGSAAADKDYTFTMDAYSATNNALRLTDYDGNGLVKFGAVSGTHPPFAVNGGIVIGSTYFANANLPPSNGMIIEGNVGIGTTEPGYPLEVNGNVKATRIGLGQNPDNAYSLIAAGSVRGVTVMGDALQTVASGGTGTVKLSIDSPAGQTGNLAQWAVSGSVLGVIQSSGNVGIGTTAPGAKMEIYPNANSTKGLIVRGDNNQSANIQEWQNNTGTNLMYLMSGGSLQLRPASNSYNQDIEIIKNPESYNTPGILISNTNTTPGNHRAHLTFLTYNYAGDTQLTSKFEVENGVMSLAVGGGDTANGSAFIVGQTVNSTSAFNGPEIRVTNDSSTTNNWSGFTFHNTGPTRAGIYAKLVDVANSYADLSLATNASDGLNSRLYVTSAGNVGIGTTGPGAKLQVQTSNNGLNIIGGFRNENGTETGGNAVGIGFLNESGGNWWKSAIVHERTSSYGQGTLHFLLDNTGDSSTVTLSDAKMSITKDGNVGIGTTSPGGLLALRGTLSSALTGTVSVTINTAAVTGVGTAFTTELAVGDSIKIGSEAFTVSAIASATSLTLDSNHLAGASGATAYRDPTLLAIDNGDAVNKLTITKTGNVGIGTTNPTQKLYVMGEKIHIENGNGSLESGGNLYLDAGVGGGGGDVLLRTDGEAPGLVLKDNTGNVGIGTTGPAQKLDVVGYIKTANGITIGGNAQVSQAIVFPNNYKLYDTGADIRFQNGSNADLLVMQSAGNVGIGTTGPSFILDVKPTTNLGGINIQGTVDNIGLRFANTGTGGLGSYIMSTAGTSGAGQGKLTVMRGSDNVNLMTWDIASGNVGIGTTAPGAALDVSGTAKMTGFQLGTSTTSGYVLTANSSGVGTWQVGGGGSGWTDGGTNVYLTTSTDNVGIGTSTTSQKLTVAGAIESTLSGVSYFNSNVGIGTTDPTAKLDVRGQMFSKRYALTDGATIAVDWNNGNVQSVTLAGNRTFTFSNGVDGAKYVLIIKQDATGSRTVTWPASARWSGGTAPTLTTTASKTDYIGFVYNGVDSKYDGVATAKNF